MKVENLYLDDISELLLNLVPDLVYETRHLSSEEFMRVKKELYLALRDAMFELKSCDDETRLYLLNEVAENESLGNEFALKWLEKLANSIGEPIVKPEPEEQRVIRVDFKGRERVDD